MSLSYGKETYYKSVLALIGLSLVAGFFVFFPITNTDIWWHLAAAREMFVRKSILYTDTFAYTLRNPQWINLHTLFQICSYGIYKAFGAGGLIVIKCMVVACICLIISLIVPDTRYMVITSALFTLLIFEVRYLILVRPIIITILCIATFLWAYEHHIRTGRKRFIWLLLPVQIMWTNSQGLFPLGIAISGCYLLGEIMQRILYLARVHPKEQVTIVKAVPADLTINFSLIISSCLLNPYGIYGFLFPIKLLQRIDPTLKNIYSSNISENLPLFELTGKDMHYLYAVLLVTAVVLCTFWINKRAFRWTHLLLFGIFLTLAVVAKRNILLYCIVAPVIIGYNCLYGYQKSNGKLHYWFRIPRISYFIKEIFIGFSTVILFIFIIIQGINISRFPKTTLFSPFRTPTGVVAYLKLHPVEGKLFNSIRHGGYLIWHFYPRKQVFVDGRLIIRSPKFFSSYLSFLDNPEEFYAAIKAYHITHVILPTALFERYLKLVKWLYHSPEWEVVFADGGSILYVKKEVLPDTCDPIDLSNSDDVEAVRKIIHDQWKDEPYIQAEALGYLNELIGYLYDLGDKAVIR